MLRGLGVSTTGAKRKGFTDITDAAGNHLPSEKAEIAAPAAPFETKTIVPAPAVAAEGAFATVYVGTTMSPMKPLVEVTGPLKVVEAILLPFA